MEFTSERKRMSVLVRDPVDNKLKLLIKGADSIIKKRMDYN
jgi:magnesium-transporting ATPase (P-type)